MTNNLNFNHFKSNRLLMTNNLNFNQLLTMQTIHPHFPASGGAKQGDRSVCGSARVIYQSRSNRGHVCCGPREARSGTGVMIANVFFLCCYYI